MGNIVERSWDYIEGEEEGNCEESPTLLLDYLSSHVDATIKRSADLSPRPGKLKALEDFTQTTSLSVLSMRAGPSAAAVKSCSDLRPTVIPLASTPGATKVDPRSPGLTRTPLQIAQAAEDEKKSPATTRLKLTIAAPAITVSPFLTPRETEDSTGGVYDPRSPAPRTPLPLTESQNSNNCCGKIKPVGSKGGEEKSDDSSSSCDVQVEIRSLPDEDLDTGDDEVLLEEEESVFIPATRTRSSVIQKVDTKCLSHGNARLKWRETGNGDKENSISNRHVEVNTHLGKSHVSQGYKKNESRRKESLMGTIAGVVQDSPSRRTGLTVAPVIAHSPQGKMSRKRHLYVL